VADCDADGLPDVCALAAGEADIYGLAGGVVACQADGIPDSCQPAADCNADGVPDACAILAGAADCDLDGLPDACELATGAAADCNGNGRLDNCDIALAASQDANQNGVPDECECATSNFCIPLPNSTGQPALISLQGLPSLSLNNATLRCEQLPPTTTGLFFHGSNSLSPGTPFGNGRLCVTGGVRRLPLVQAVAGVVNQPQDFGGTAYAGIQAGDVRFFQFWYRNTAAGGAGFNLSDGIRVTFCP
jgi:hypothetical protein